MPSTRNNTPYKDFNPDDMVQASQYQKDIDALDKRIQALEEKFGTHEHIANTLSDTADLQVKMQEMLTKMFIKVLNTNEDVKKAVGMVIDGYDRQKFRWITGKIGFGIWSIFLAVVAFILSKVIH